MSCMAEKNLTILIFISNMLVTVGGFVFSLVRGLNQHPLGEIVPSLSKEWVGPRNKTLGIHRTEGRGPQSCGNHGALGKIWPMKILPW